jgi:predicted small secreted protein
MRRTTALLAALLVTSGVVAACSNADDDAGTDAATEDTVVSDEDSGDASAGEGLTAGGSSAGAGGAQAPTDAPITEVPDIDLVAAQVDRKIIYTGEVTSEVDDVAAATRSARDSVAAEGGFVFGQEISEGTARVVLKVPTPRFDAAFDAVAGIGEVTSQFIEADDVSEQFTDLESRLNTLATSIDRLRGFLANAANVDEISRLEGELTRREAEHDVIAGQLRVLRDRTSLGTITVTFLAVDDDAAALREDDEAGGPPGFGRGLEVGWDAVVVMAGAVATAAGFALPFLPVLAVAALALWLVSRSRGPRPSRA